MSAKIIPAIRANAWLTFIIALFVALASVYSIATPVFEAGDELWHYPFVQSLATGNSLPVQNPNIKTLWEQEGGQPPLYYALAALATSWIDTGDLTERLWRNPEAKIGIPLEFGNKNMVVHTSAEDFPWHNTALAVHLLRFLSILLSALTVLFTYWLALDIKDDKNLASVAAALVAFNPMFLFISASVNNDNLAVMLAALALLLLARLLTRGPTRRRFVVLGCVLGLAALSKVSDLGLLVVAALLFTYLLWRQWNEDYRGSPREISARLRAPAFVRILGSGLLCALLVVLIAGWWYVRNWLVYGDPLALNVWVEIAGGRPTPATLATLLGEFQGFRISYWGNFGGVNLIAPDWVYTILDAFTALAAVGLLVGMVRRALPRLIALPAIWLGLIMIALVRWTWLTFASQGRLVFPAVGAVAILLAYGLAQFSIPFSRFPFSRLTPRVLLFSCAALLFVFSALAPFLLIAPAYAQPARLPGDAPVPNPTLVIFEDQAELVGYVLPQKSVAPGGELPVTIYWKALARMTEDYSVYLRLFDAAGNVVGRWEAFPGGGLYPTRLWQPGEIIVDQYRVPVSFDARGPSVGHVEAGLFRRVPLENLTARDPRGNTVTPVLARFKITGPAQEQIQSTQEPINFGDKMSLIDFTRPPSVKGGSLFMIKLHWRALSPLVEDYAIFIHLLDAAGKTVAQKDDQPQQGRYPTSFWDVGETIEDEYAVPIPADLAGVCRIQIGIYRSRDGSRLPVRGGDSVELGSVTVSP